MYDYLGLCLDARNINQAFVFQYIISYFLQNRELMKISKKLRLEIV